MAVVSIAAESSDVDFFLLNSESTNTIKRPTSINIITVPIPALLLLLFEVFFTGVFVCCEILVFTVVLVSIVTIGF